MKKTMTGIAGLFFCMGLYAQKLPSTEVVPPIKLLDAADSMQYTLGAYIAQWINTNGFHISKAEIFLRGLDDIFRNRPRAIPDSTIAPAMAVYQREALKASAGKQEKQLFASLNEKPGVGMFPNGVRYIILRTGKGPRPAESDSIVVNLIAKLANGTIVEDTYQSKKPFDAIPASFFPGLNAALQEMPEGSKWTLYVPSVLAYGDKGTTLIPPNSALVLEVELMEVKAGKKQ